MFYYKSANSSSLPNITKKPAETPALSVQRPVESVDYESRRLQLQSEIKSLNKQIRRLEVNLEKGKHPAPPKTAANDSDRGEEQFTEEPLGFDFLTKPKEAKEQPVPESLVSVPEETLRGDRYIQQSLRQLNLHYNSQLKKKFERREQFPHLRRRKLPPKLVIANNMLKAGFPQNYREHLFRVLMKEKTPQQLEAMIPTFNTVKDTVSKNVMAYLKDFRPFLESIKEEIPKVIQDIVIRKQ